MSTLHKSNISENNSADTLSPELETKCAADDAVSQAEAKSAGGADRTAAQDEHILHLWEPFSFKVEKGYDFRRSGILKTSGYYLTRGAVHIILNVLNRTAFGLRVRGRGNLRQLKDQGVVVVCNHVHPMDCTVIDCVMSKKRMYYTTLESNFRIPVARHLIRVLGGVPIPTDIHMMNDFADEMEAALREKRGVCVYPEGVLHPYYNGVRRFKSGAFSMAAQTGMPVLPMLMTFRKPRGAYMLKRKPCLTLNILPPIYPVRDNDPRSEAKRLCSLSHSAMLTAFENLRK